MSFTFAVGSRELSNWINVTPGDGLDLYDGDLVEPQFSQSPLREGAQHIQDIVGPREMAVPVILNPRPYVATNAMQNPGLEAGTAVRWDLALWTGGTHVVTTEWADSERGGEWSIKYHGTSANQNIQGNVLNGAASYLAVPSVNGDWRVLFALTLAGPSAVDTSLQVQWEEADGTAQVGGIVGDSRASPGRTHEAWAGSERGVRVWGIATAPPSVVYVQPRVRLDAAAVPTYSQLEMYADNALMVLLPPAASVGAGPPDRDDHFDGDHLDAYWTGERGNSYSVTRTGKGGLRDMLGDLERELHTPGQQVKWRDFGASQTTFFDLLRGRFEPAQNYRREQRDHGEGVVRLWTGPYGHTGTERIVATAAGAGLVERLTVGGLAGDIDAVPVATIQTGPQLAHGRLIGLAQLPHPSYAMIATPATLDAANPQGALIGDHSSPGSQAYSGGNFVNEGGLLFRVPLPIPSVYEGANRLLLVHRSGLHPGVCVRAFDWNDQPIGPTVMATFGGRYMTADMGVLRLVLVPAPRARAG